MADLRTRYLGLDRRSPLVASSSPLTGSLDGLRRLEAAGAGAVVLPSLFEEELAEPGRERPPAGAGGEDRAGYGAGPAAYLSLVERARRDLSIPVIASLNGVRAVRQATGLPLAVKLSRTSARSSTWPGSWSRPAPTGWSCSTASTSPTWTSRPWRCCRPWS
jgi:dihydroorotate dehydrogenase